MAFTTTASCAALIVAGFLGYALIGQGQFSGGRSWSDATIWWQIWLGWPFCYSLPSRGAGLVCRRNDAVKTSPKLNGRWKTRTSCESKVIERCVSCGAASQAARAGDRGPTVRQPAAARNGRDAQVRPTPQAPPTNELGREDYLR